MARIGGVGVQYAVLWSTPAKLNRVLGDSTTTVVGMGAVLAVAPDVVVLQVVVGVREFNVDFFLITLNVGGCEMGSMARLLVSVGLASFTFKLEIVGGSLLYLLSTLGVPLVLPFLIGTSAEITVK